MTERPPPPFAVFDGLPPKDTRHERLHKSKPPSLVRCRRCAGGSIVTVRMGMTYNPKGVPVGGVKALVCAICLARGDHVLI